jgi:ABC exporter DevB family membrane fusion protein
MDRFQPFHGLIRSMSCLAICSIITCGCQSAVNDNPLQPQYASEVARQVVALGRLEPYGGIRSIGALPGQRLRDLQPEVQEGEVLTIPAASHSPAGISAPEGNRLANSHKTPEQEIPEQVSDPYLLGHLDSHTIRQSQLTALLSKRGMAEKQQQGEIRLAEVQSLQATASYRQAMAKLAEIEAQKARLDNLREAAELTNQQYETLLRLSQDDPELVTAHQLARQKNQSERAMLEYKAASLSLGPTLEAATATVQAAKLGVEVAETNRNQHQEIGQYQLAAIDMEIEAAKQLVSQAELRLPQNENKDVENGDALEVQYTVLKVFTHPGELITQLPILQVGNLNRMACIAEVYEADAKQIRVDQKATIRSPAFSGDYAPYAKSGPGGLSGTVRRISYIISSPGLTDRNPLAPMDRSIVEVLIEIDNNDIAAIQEASKRIGLQVTVEFGEMPTEQAEREE